MDYGDDDGDGDEIAIQIDNDNGNDTDDDNDILVMSMLMAAGEHTKPHQVAKQIDNGNDDGDNDNGGEHDNYEGRTPKGGSTINETRFE